MKTKHLFTTLLGITAIISLSCNSYLYRASYDDDLYFVPGNGVVSPSDNAETIDSRKIVSTDSNYRQNADEYANHEEEYFLNDTRVNSYITFSIASPGFYAALNSPFWGGWFYPYYGPYSRYLWIDPYFDYYFYNPYAWYYPPFWHSPWLYYGYLWHSPWGYWGYNGCYIYGNSSYTNRDHITHRRGLITGRLDNSSTASRSLGRGTYRLTNLNHNNTTRNLTTTIQEPSRAGKSRGNEIRSNTNNSGNVTMRRGSQNNINRGRTAQESRTTTHTRESRQAEKDNLLKPTKPFRSNLGVNNIKTPINKIDNSRSGNIRSNYIETDRTYNGNSRSSNSRSSEPRVIRSENHSNNSPSINRPSNNNNNRAYTPSHQPDNNRNNRTEGSRPTRSSGRNHIR